MMANFPKFQEFNPNDDDFTCIHPCISKERQRCTKKVNKNDRRSASDLKAKISSSCHNAELLKQDLRKYAELCCWTGVHRKRAIKLGLLDEVVSWWILESVGKWGVSPITNVGTPVVQRFLTYAPQAPKDNLEHIFSFPLIEQEFQAGTIYMIRRNEDPGYVKIGLTCKITDDRFSFFRLSCEFEPIPLRQIRHVPYVRRVERLIHAKLKTYRRECTTCIHRSGCGCLHNEWFQIEDKVAMEVMEKWARWATYADPYDMDGHLKTIWLKVELEARRSGKLPTCDKVTEELEAQQAREHVLVTHFAKISIGSKVKAQLVAQEKGAAKLLKDVEDAYGQCAKSHVLVSRFRQLPC